MDLMDLLIGLLESDSLPSYIIFLILIAAIVAILTNFVGLVDKLHTIFRRILVPVQDQETRDFIVVRSYFVQALISHMWKLNQAADWSDINYTELEAEVEVNVYAIPTKPLSGLLGTTRDYLQLVTTPIRPSKRPSVVRNLVKAIRTNKQTRAFLVVGDPGSGKTVSLRHLFLELAMKAEKSKDPKTTIPLYFNLKGLNLSSEEITPDTLYEWIYTQLTASNDRFVNEFVERNFARLLKHGQLFFIFDSFDEIPGVMDSGEDSSVVQKYAQTLSDFILGGHGCSGLLSSRPYRAPKAFIGQRLTIRALSTKQIRKAISRYLRQEPQLSRQVADELLYLREDLRYLARNPFYLSLLARYAKKEGKVPDRQFELFEHFVNSRLKEDIPRLAGMGYTPQELVWQSSRLAYAMFSSPKIGLEGTIEDIHLLLAREQGQEEWKLSDTSQLVEALGYAKIGRVEEVGTSLPRRFSFAHRRFHEYFAARYLQQQIQQTPLTEFAADNRWREVLVLLCEVISMRHLTSLFRLARENLRAGLTSDPEEETHRRAIETLRFLRDGFQAHFAYLPIELRELAADFIGNQFASNNFLATKRAVENLALVPPEQMVALMERVFSSPSEWVRETALRSCRYLTKLPEKLETLIRWHLRDRYWNRTWPEYSPIYRVIFSSYPFVSTVRPYVRFLNLGDYLSNIGMVVGIFFVLLNVIIGGLRVLIPVVFLSGMFLIFPLMGRFTVPDEYKQHYGLEFKNGSTVFKINPDRKSSAELNLFLNWTGWLGSVLALLAGLEVGFTWPTFVSNFLFGLFLFITFFNFILLPWIYLPSSIDELKRTFAKWYAFREQIFANVVSLVKKLLFAILTLILIGFSIALLLSLNAKYGFLYAPPPPTQVTTEQTEAPLLGVLFMIGLLAAFLVWVLFKLLRETVKTLVQGWGDTRLLLNLVASSRSRPISAVEASDLLEAFEYTWARERFLASLPAWLPIGPDPEILIDIASGQSGSLRDRLFQLAENGRMHKFRLP